MAACLSCRVAPPATLTAETETADYQAMVAEHLLSFCNATPLDGIAWLAWRFEATPTVVSDVLSAYDSFLSILNDEEKRGHLEKMSPQNAAADTLFREAREIGDRFQKGLVSLFFDTNRELTVACQRYGVF